LGRSTGFGRAATRTRWRCISPPLCCGTRQVAARPFRFDRAKSVAHARRAGASQPQLNSICAVLRSDPVASPRRREPCLSALDGVRPNSRGSRTPKAMRPARFRNGYRADGSPSSDPGRNRTRTSPGKSRELSIELRSQSQSVAGGNRTCDAPRFRRALYRAELRPRASHGRGWNRTSGLLCVRQAL
jgi:hypothetical protein